jgi:uncharacterized protein
MNIPLPTGTSQRKSPLAFFLLGIALGIVYFILAAARVLPVAALAAIGAFLPVTTALILVYRDNRLEGMVELLMRSFDFNRIKSRIWYVPVLLLWPLIVSVQYGLALVSGLPVSSPNFSFWTPTGIAISFVLALGEELGWMGYTFDPMEERLGALKASVLLGIIWASVHLMYFVSSGASADWIAWQFVYIATTRVLFAWIYNSTGKSVFAIAIMHTLFNQIWLVFPRNEGLVGLSVPLFYSPSNLAITTIALATIVTFLWGSKTLAQYRYSRLS